MTFSIIISHLSWLVLYYLYLFSDIGSYHFVRGDVYMHNPRGSNDRNCERNANRNNENRLFNSQNNNAGGYACPRGVGDETFQAEDGSASFIDSDGNTHYQNKRMYYYEGSVLPIEWTNQHGCGGNSKVSCEIVLQYACEDTLDPRVDDFWPWVKNKAEKGTTFYGKQHFRSDDHIAAPRDGVPRDSNDAATDTIPDAEASAISSTIETRRFGMQESYDYYQLCKSTARNRGLYTADQILQRNDQRATRTNPNGDRRGFECPEERDYYPWWHPSPWIDIAVLTDSGNDSVCSLREPQSCSTRCDYYLRNTMNFNPKGYCDVNHNVTGATVTSKLSHSMWIQNKWYNNRYDCVHDKSGLFAWYEISHSDNLQLSEDSFVCAKTQFARVNQLGNARSDDVVSQSQPVSVGGVVSQHIIEAVNANRFLWTIPTIPKPKIPDYFTNDTLVSAYKSCVLRIRYNISSADFQQWPVDAVDPGTQRMVDASDNGKNAPLKQDEYVYIGPGDAENKADYFVALKLNTNQYGRIFQDRSYVFSIKPLPSRSADADNNQDTPMIDAVGMQQSLKNGGKIYNVNVRGKRGNIVQVYPSVEYDFVPNALALNLNDMIHFQWTGSDYNPRRGCNDGTGGPPDANAFSTDANANLNPRADRSNIVFTNHMGNNAPKDYNGYTQTAKISYDSKWILARNKTLLNNGYVNGSPCYDDNGKYDETTMNTCYESIRRLAYLNQQSDKLSLTYRANKPCLTLSDLNTIKNRDVADFHPLNCAKLNAKPFPYFDAGIMFMKNFGKFPYFSSRNNNFSNRQQIGIICVKDENGKGCEVDPDTKVLQDQNPMTNGGDIYRTSPPTNKPTITPSNEPTSYSSLLPSSTPSISPTTAAIITTETFTAVSSDNDLLGDGNMQGCAANAYASSSSSSSSSSSDSNEKSLIAGISIGLFFLGLFTSWLTYYLYNRYQARKEAEGKFRHDTSWQTADIPDKGIRPSSGAFFGINPSAKSLASSDANSSSNSSRRRRKEEEEEDNSPLNKERKEMEGLSRGGAIEATVVGSSSGSSRGRGRSASPGRRDNASSPVRATSRGSAHKSPSRTTASTRPPSKRYEMI